MDYEKKYKQLHTLISDLYPLMSEYCKEKVEGFFPELAGSKDERIRKALLEMVHDTTGDELWVDYNVHKEEALSWLEKQGKSSDQIHYWTEEEIEPIISDYLRGAEHYGGMIARLRCLKPKSLEKQSETYTKRDVDDAWLKGMCDAKRELEKQAEVVSDKDDVEAEEKGIRKAFNKIWEEKQDKQKSQRMISAEAKEAMYDKPAWSEEDEEYINDLIGVFDGQQYQAHSDEEIVKWLKSIRLPYNKEWDENDEEMLRSIIATCELAEQDRDSSPARHLLEMQLDWLKSLRPQNRWKPSDEQMATLYKYAEQNNYDGSILTSLYNDLKKLREE